MRKMVHRAVSAGYFRADSRFDSNIESFKRRRALAPSSFEMDSRSFFDRILNVKKFRELVFVTNAKAKGR